MSHYRTMIKSTRRVVRLKTSWCVVIIGLMTVSTRSEESVGRRDAGARREQVRANQPVLTPGTSADAEEPRAGSDTRRNVLTKRHSGANDRDGDTGFLSGPRWTDILGPLVLVLGLIAAATWAARRWLPRGGGLDSRGMIRILARQHLSSKQSICLVRLGPRVLVIGVSPEQVTCLSEIRDAQEAAMFMTTAEQAKAESFSSLLRKLSHSTETADILEDASCLPAQQSPQVAQAGRQVSGLLARVRELAASPTSVEPA